MTDPIEHYRDLNAERDRIYPSVLAEIARRYTDEKVPVAVLAKAAGVSHLTVYHWLHDAGAQMSKRGRPKRTPEPPPAVKEPVSLEPRFEWFTNDHETVLVTVGTRIARVNRDRLYWVPGGDVDIELGQNLVSGKNLDLVQKFERFVKEND